VTINIEDFIARWSGQEGGQERANYALFLSELCDVLGTARPDPANADTQGNDYVFERVVKEKARDGRNQPRAGAAACHRLDATIVLETDAPVEIGSAHRDDGGGIGDADGMFRFREDGGTAMISGDNRIP
jgi:hypothetical protein